jgi:hypothetical protein
VNSEAYDLACIGQSKNEIKDNLTSLLHYE